MCAAEQVRQADGEHEGEVNEDDMFNEQFGVY